MSDEAPFSLRRKIAKKSCALLQDREESDPQCERVAQRVNEAVRSLTEMLSDDATSLEKAAQSMDRVSVLLNKFVLLPEESHAPLLVIVSQLLRHLHGFSGAGPETAWSRQWKADETLSAPCFAAITRLVLSLLSTYPKNEGFSELFEGDVWPILMVLTPLSVLSDVDARRFRAMSLPQ